MSENKRLSERNAKIAAMLSDGEQLKNFYRFIAQNPYINLHDACQIVIERPDATVCNSMEEWNALGRRVTKGRKAISYYDHDGYKQFVFDAADTHGEERYQRPIFPLKRLLIGLDELNGTALYDDLRGDYRKIHNGVYTYLEKSGALTGDEQHDNLLSEGVAFSLYCKTGFPKTAGIHLRGLPYSYRENAEFVKEMYIQAELLAEEIDEAYEGKLQEVKVIDDTEEETVTDEPIIRGGEVEQTKEPLTEETEELPEQGNEVSVSPIYRQYLDVQKANPQAVVLLRLGDFYEIMGENARTVNEKLCSIIDEAAKLGVDTFVLDDGWFGKRDDDTSGLGDWFVNERKLKGGLKAVIGHCKEKGLKFGLWFEPEMVSEDSELYRAHPDWAIGKAGVEPCRGRNQLVLDFTRKEVVDYIFETVSKILRENDISYVKWDKNRDITENYTANLPADRQGEFWHRYTLGFYDLAKRLTESFPNVFFEGCAGGGGRFDGGALYYFPQIWTSDDTDGLERTKIQWGTSACYPVSAMSCHVSACPNHQTGRTTPFATRGAIASLGATGYELDLTKLSEEEKMQVREQIENYKQIDGLVLKGDLYRLADPFKGNYFCEMLVSKDKSKAYVVGERFRGDPCDHDRVLKLCGLDEEKTYTVKELNVTASGAALMGAGLFCPRLPDCGSWVWHIGEVCKKG